MPVVLVHGVPETAAIWDPMLAELERDDVITLSPPGFGAPAPGGFGATSDDYVTWLAGELEQLSGPIDLVGHDWGGGHAARLATARPDLIRSWCIDIAGVFDPGYIWHDLAQIWQTPGKGEELISYTNAVPLAERAAQLEAVGMTPAAAQACAAAAGPDMGRCILALYRSARQPIMATWGREFEQAERRPGLVVCAASDSFVGGPELAHRMAGRLGAAEVVLPGAGHWWMLQDPARAAAVLRDWLAGLG
jgi:pimeloyl-ACP methyl ester carboxylesterase